MRERNVTNNMESRLMDLNALCSYLNVGRNKAIEFAKDSAAIKHIGRRCLYDKKKIDQALDSLTD